MGIASDVATVCQSRLSFQSRLRISPLLLAEWGRRPREPMLLGRTMRCCFGLAMGRLLKKSSKRPDNLSGLTFTTRAHEMDAIDPRKIHNLGDQFPANVLACSHRRIALL